MGQDKRLELQGVLETVLESTNVYFQPPVNVQIKYPALVYSRDSARIESADNRGYRFTQRYQVTYISNDPDNEIIEKMVGLGKCSYVRGFVSDGLTHDVFSLYH